jgi:hypothetical protein
MKNTRKTSWYKQKSKYIRFNGGYEQRHTNSKQIII